MNPTPPTGREQRHQAREPLVYRRPLKTPDAPMKARVIGKGDFVRHLEYTNGEGWVGKSTAKMIYVEWIGFPPNVPADGWQNRSRSIVLAALAPTQRKSQAGGRKAGK